MLPERCGDEAVASDGHRLHAILARASNRLRPVTLSISGDHCRAEAGARRMTDDSFPQLRDMLAEVERTAALAPDVIRAVADAVKTALEAEVDPYRLSGTLVEAIATTVVRDIPPEQQKAVADQLILLLLSRLRALGMIHRPPGRP
jgi:hypothetical protein